MSKNNILFAGIILIASASISYAAEKTQKAFFCADTYSAAPDDRNCEKDCSLYNCSAESLIKEGWQIKIVTPKTKVIREFKAEGGLMFPAAFPTMCNSYECFQVNGRTYYWHTKPTYQGCHCQGNEYIVEK